MPSLCFFPRLRIRFPLVNLHKIATTAQVAMVPVPPGKRAPFGWSVFALPLPGQGEARLTWAPHPPTDAASVPARTLAGHLRFTTAIDDRECKVVAVRLAASGRPLGQLDLRYAHALETFALPLDGTYLEAARAEGVVLSLVSATSPLWLLAPAVGAEAPGLAPSLLPETPKDTRSAAHLHWLASLNSLHTWGWMEGCVLDALEDLHVAYPDFGFSSARRDHLARFFPADGSLRGENPRSEPCDDTIYGIEATLMFSALASDQRSHPWVDRAVAWWLGQANAEGAILDETLLSAEGSYTIAYPLARVAALREREDLGRTALVQLDIRRRLLWHEDAVWLRYHFHDGSRTFRNWARGVAWHFLGSARSARELSMFRGLERGPLGLDLRRLADLALATQLPDGLWRCFLDEPATAPDTSGSAGIATALALCARHGWIEPEPALAAAGRAEAALLLHLAADGQLDGVAQSNRGGEELQRSDYRVLSSMGAGLLGQLRAALTA
jgi:unsaturated rhamnogalacturonyl hydrolase